MAATETENERVAAVAALLKTQGDLLVLRNSVARLWEVENYWRSRVRPYSGNPRQKRSDKYEQNLQEARQTAGRFLEVHGELVTILSLDFPKDTDLTIDRTLPPAKIASRANEIMAMTESKIVEMAQPVIVDD